MAAFAERTGRAQALWLPFTKRPWLKTWSRCPARPPGSREVRRPYNYGHFTDDLPRGVRRAVERLGPAMGAATPALAKVSYASWVLGLRATRTTDLWGRSKDLLLFIRANVPHAAVAGYAVACRRADVQRVVSDFTDAYAAQLDAHRSRGAYPVNLPVEIRVTGLDVPEAVLHPAAEAPVLSAVSPRRDRPDWGAAVWFDVSYLPGTPLAEAFMRELEAWLMGRFDGSWAAVRPEWSKVWGFGDRGPWDEDAPLARAIPALYREGRRADENWDWATRTLRSYDPHRVWSNPFLDRLLG
jgi:hypothetical protein